ncbi:exonuclease domain-containing protein [Desulfitobacterium sp.]|uniref:exonuclease domain-containing protein n=1 Tax=Desulfitobacterium sp. TaxID=49981 RepID=UPI002BF9583C|nr:exonuclease domain-containing protein [Desulfitobacterium sp.]HVJ49245.1 exonuclease domain-containing protein [Desulfitobacterium sp.]
MNFVAIDFETANEKLSSSCAIGIAVVKDSKIIETKHLFIQPPDLNFNLINYAIHGITKEDVKDKLKFGDLWESIKSYFEGAPVIAHNASFDMSVLRQTLDQYQIPYPEVNYACTLVISKKVWPNQLSYKLDGLSSMLEIKLNHHNAESDAIACALIAIKAANEISATSFDELINKVHVNYGQLYPGGYSPSSSKQTQTKGAVKKTEVQVKGDSKKFNSRAEIEKIINTLTGILQGITVDKIINFSEIEELNHWCNFYRKYENRHPFNELFPIIDTVINNGFLSKEETDDIYWLVDKLTNNEFCDQTNSSMQILHGILHGILVDNILTDEEILKLSDWIHGHDFLSNIYPYDEIKSLLNSVLSDGVIDEDEREMLKAFFSEFIDTTLSYNLNQNELNALKSKYNVSGICTTCPEIIFTGASFCFTGASTRAPRSEIKGLIEQTGATFSDSVTMKTDYLVIGDDGNPSWVFTRYGRKVEKAISMRKAGQRISIIRENDLWDELKIWEARDKTMAILISSELCDQIVEMIRAKEGPEAEIETIYNSAYSSIKFLGIHSLRVKCGRTNYIYLKNSYEHVWANDKSIKLEQLPSEKLWSRLSFNSQDELTSLYPLFLKLYEESFSLVNVEVYSCCSRFIQCSDEKVCIQPNKRLALGCQYRKHLTNGRIFYGVNQNMEFR